MYFSIGGHPGFLYDGPIGEQVLTFSEKENIDRVLLSPAMQFSRDVTKDYVKNGEPIALYEGIFVDDALVFHGFKSNKIGLLNPSTGRGVEMDLTGFPYVGIWAVDKPGCPYACIEPWFGLADYDDFEGELPEKDGIEMLPANGVFNCAFTVKVL
jgi:galactose mutarotase-like enzyme